VSAAPTEPHPPQYPRSSWANASRHQIFQTRESDHCECENNAIRLVIVAVAVVVCGVKVPATQGGDTVVHFTIHLSTSYMSIQYAITVRRRSIFLQNE